MLSWIFFFFFSKSEDSITFLSHFVFSQQSSDYTTCQHFYVYIITTFLLQKIKKIASVLLITGQDQNQKEMLAYSSDTPDRSATPRQLQVAKVYLLVGWQVIAGGWW